MMPPRCPDHPSAEPVQTPGVGDHAARWSCPRCLGHVDWVRKARALDPETLASNLARLQAGRRPPPLPGLADACS